MLRTLWPISQEPEFSQIRDLCRNTVNNINFHYRTNSAKINDKFSKYSKNPVIGPFLVHFLNFGGKKFFLENLVLLRTTSYGFLAPCQNLEKTNDTIPRKRLTEGREDGQTLFHRALPATTRGPKMYFLRKREKLLFLYITIPKGLLI